MCGICGIVDTRGKIRPELLKSMASLLVHRGPDEEGFHIETHVGLAHRRLSIIDLSSGRQPIYNETNKICIVFNGEIYNYRSLRDELISKGHIFTTNSDTEVILHLFEEKGSECVNYLRGMFAFAIWDSEKQELFIARDRIGKKPLYYTKKSGLFIFASEMKSLLVHPDVLRTLDYGVLAEFLTYNYISAPRTILSGVFKLEPGHLLWWKRGEVEKKQYWNLQYSPKINVTESDAVAYIQYLIDDAVQVRLESDVPLGCLLSGGIDSAATVALMRRHVQGDLHTFTIGFEEEEFNELDGARLVAQKFDTRHHEFIVKANAIEVLPKLVWHLDEPFGDSSSLAAYYVTKMARKMVTVVLNGDGGDESFFGYTRYFPDPEDDFMTKWMGIPEPIRRYAIQPLAKAFFSIQPFSPCVQRFYNGNSFSLLDKYQRYVHSITSYKNNTLGLLAGPAIPDNLWSDFSTAMYLEKMLEEDGLSLEEQMIRADVNIYLPGDLLVKMDRMAMANSVEARSPFLDHHLMEYAASLPYALKIKNNDKKYLLKLALRGLVPDEILDGRKRGFTVPIKNWFRRDLNQFAKDVLLSKKVAERGLVNQRFIRVLLKEHESGRRDYHSAIWSLLNLEMWCRTFLDRSDLSGGAL